MVMYLMYTGKTAPLPRAALFNNEHFAAPLLAVSPPKLTAGDIQGTWFAKEGMVGDRLKAQYDKKELHDAVRHLADVLDRQTFPRSRLPCNGSVTTRGSIRKMESISEYTSLCRVLILLQPEY